MIKLTPTITVLFLVLCWFEPASLVPSPRLDSASHGDGLQVWSWGSRALCHEPTAIAQESPDIAAAIEKYVGPMVDADQLSGTLLVTRGDSVLFERSWGQANREQNIPFTPDTTCCVASVTKPTTVILAAKLIDEGTLALDDPISNWLDDFPNGDKIRIKHLLFHTSGVPHRLTEEDDETEPRTAADMVELARRSKFEFEPEKGYRYSSGGYSVLIRVLELASGKSYEQLLDSIILKPLELSNTFHPGPGVTLRNAATSYSWTVDGRKPAAAKHYSFLVGAGSLFSTPRDLSAISRALVAGRFGEQAKRRLLRGGKLRWNGITNHFRAFLEYDAKTDVTVVWVANQMVGANDLLRQAIPKIIAGDSPDPPTIPKPKVVELSPELIAKYSGDYDIAGSRMPVQARDGALFANDWILLPISETRFFSPQDYGTVEVIIENGLPTALDWSGMKCPRLGPLKK